jgi:hypothetical protein
MDHLPEGEWPQQGRERIILPPPIAIVGTGQPTGEHEALARLGPDTVMMMGDNPALPRMPEAPTLLDFFRLRITGITAQHLLTSAKRAMDEGQEEKIVLACLLHDISNACLIRADHGYWGAQMIAPYVDEEVAWAVQQHQALRYFADPSVGYEYPESYHRFFGEDYVPPDYIKRDAEAARTHRWYMSARLVTLYDRYFFDDTPAPPPESLTDGTGRHYPPPSQGLGIDGSPTAHMWRTMIWPNNFL